LPTPDFGKDAFLFASSKDRLIQPYIRATKVFAPSYPVEGMFTSFYMRYKLYSREQPRSVK